MPLISMELLPEISIHTYKQLQSAGILVCILKFCIAMIQPIAAIWNI